MASMGQGGSAGNGGASGRPRHRPLQLAGGKGTSRGHVSGGASRDAGSVRAGAAKGGNRGPAPRDGRPTAHRTSRSPHAQGGRPSPRRQAGARVNRTRYGYPTVSERLVKGAGHRGGSRRNVIGTTVRHDGSLGYIRRGPFGAGSRRRGGLLRMAPYALGIVAAVLVLWSVGSAVQGGLGLFAAPQEEAPVELPAISGAMAEGMAVPPDQAHLQAVAPGARVLDPGRLTASGAGHVTFSAVGDNIANENLLEIADAAAGETGDDQYDFNAFYDGIRDAVRSYDISLINQETTLGGPDRYGYNGYPSFNTPDSMADAIASAGWDVVSINSNHTYDTGEEAIQHGLAVWQGKASDLLAIGSYATAEERDRVQLVECNGVRIAFLSYCYGQNGYDQSELPNDFYSVPYVREDMQADVARARTVADAVVVYMHWGTEYTHEPDETQRAWAQELADAGVDLVVGSHAHVIQPMEWLEGAGGKTLVVYGLGDVWSGYDSYPECVLSGMFTCEFVKLGADAAAEAGRGVSIENVVWHPLIEHMENGTDTVYLVSDYSAEQANANELLGDVEGDRYTWMCDLSRQVIGEDFTVDL